MATKVYLLSNTAMLNTNGTLKAPLGITGYVTYIPINCERIEYTVTRQPNIFAVPISSYNAVIDYGAKKDSLHITKGILSGTTGATSGDGKDGWVLRGNTTLQSLNVQQQRVYLLSALGAGPWGNVDIVPTPSSYSGYSHTKIEPHKVGTMVYPSISKIHWGDPSNMGTKLLFGPIVVEKFTMIEIGGEITKYEFDLDVSIIGFDVFVELNPFAGESTPLTY